MQYFYEPFLTSYDPVPRKRLGVWFTPSDVARYMVARIDKVLREQLHVANGFADPAVFVLDPAGAPAHSSSKFCARLRRRSRPTAGAR